MSKGKLFIISGPSGSGKDTVLSCLLSKHTEIKLSISSITRPMRNGEVEGQKYHFISREEFESMIENDQLLEHNVFVGNYYGTPKAPVEKMLAEGKDVILEIEPQGAMKVMDQYPEGVFIFIFPPSMEELRNRLRGRGTEEEDVIAKRLARAEQELTLAEKYSYYVINNTVEEAKTKIEAIISSEKLRKERCKINLK